MGDELKYLKMFCPMVPIRIFFLSSNVSQHYNSVNSQGNKVSVEPPPPPKKKATSHKPSNKQNNNNKEHKQTHTLTHTKPYTHTHCSSTRYCLRFIEFLFVVSRFGSICSSARRCILLSYMVTNWILSLCLRFHGDKRRGACERRVLSVVLLASSVRRGRPR